MEKSTRSNEYNVGRLSISSLMEYKIEGDNCFLPKMPISISERSSPVSVTREPKIKNLYLFKLTCFAVILSKSDFSFVNG